MPTNPGDHLRITAVMSWGVAQSAMNVFDFQLSGSFSATDSEIMEVMDDYLSACYGVLDPDLSNQLLAVEIRGFNVTRDQPMPTRAWTGWVGGTQTTDFLPHGVAGLVLFRTNKSRCVGRKFIAGLNDQSVAGGLVITSTLAHLAEWGAAINTGWSDTPTGVVVNFLIYNKLGFGNEVTTIVASALPAYQRRRRPGRGV